VYHRRVESFARAFIRLAVAAAICGLAGSTPGCRREPPPVVTMEGRTLTIMNASAEEWRSVEVWLNDHYRVTKPSMPPGERFNIPLNAFVAGFGQRFDPVRQVVRGVEVTAITAGGGAVRIDWGDGRRR
jgi:hypothetical protein